MTPLLIAPTRGYLHRARQLAGIIWLPNHPSTFPDGDTMSIHYWFYAESAFYVRSNGWFHRVGHTAQHAKVKEITDCGSHQDKAVVPLSLSLSLFFLQQNHFY